MHGCDLNTSLLTLGSTSSHSLPTLLGQKIGYSPTTSFAPVGLIGRTPTVLLAHPGLGSRYADVIERLRSQPGRINYASSGNGTVVHLGTEYFKAQAGLFIVHIPYKGTALAIPDLVSGKLDVLFDSLPTGMPHVRDGRLRALGITTLKRSPLAPELPPIADVLPGYESTTWFGLYGPKGLPPELQQRINVAAGQTLADPEVRDKLQRMGIEAVTGSAQQLAAMVAADTAKWKKIIVERRISTD